MVDSLPAGWLAPVEGAPWWWSEANSVLVSTTGATVAFLPEVRRILLRIAREIGTVPPFTSLALLLQASTADSRGFLPEPCRAAIWAEIRALPVLPRAKLPLLVGLTHVERALAVLGRLPDEFWAHPEARETLASFVYSDPDQMGVVPDTEALLEALQGELHPRSFWRLGRSRAGLEPWAQSVSLLLHGLAKIDPDSLLLRLRTGLDGLPRAAALEVPAEGGARRLIEELKNDETFGEVAALARRLLATLYLPRPVAPREDLPLGGLSDITNRGPLDRLLISELAHDDLTLAVRIALNEALYVRRESPPRPLTGARHVLLDAGIRMWGVARVFAAAVGLALVAEVEEHRPVRVWRSARGAPIGVDLTRREGLVALLESLEAAPHPAASVETFLSGLPSATDGGQCFLVTHPRVLADPDFRSAMERLNAAGALVVLVDESGHLRIEAHGPRGSRTVHEAALDLASLHSAVPWSEVRNVLEAQPPQFNTILPSPLLLPHRLDGSRFARAPDGAVLAYTPHDDLVVWAEEGDFARVLCTFQGTRSVLRFACVDGVVDLVREDARKRILRDRFDLETRNCTTEDIAPAPGGLKHAHPIGPALLLASAERSWLYQGKSAGGAAPLTRLAGWWLGGRYFRTPGNGLAILRLNASGAVLEPIETSVPTAESVFDLAGSEDPWCVRRIPFGSEKGNLVACTIRGEHERPIPSPFHVAGPLRFEQSEDSVVRDVTGNWELDVRKGWIRHTWQIASGPGSLPRGCNVRTRVNFIGVDSHGDLQLHFKGGLAASLYLEQASSEDKQWGLILDTKRDALQARTAFLPVRSSDRRIVRCATSANGDRALLDQRGLLHLVPRSTARLQMTVLLRADGPSCPLWLSDGMVHGPEIFLPPSHRHTTPAMVRQVLRQFAEGFA